MNEKKRDKGIDKKYKRNQVFFFSIAIETNLVAFLSYKIECRFDT